MAPKTYSHSIGPFEAFRYGNPTQIFGAHRVEINATRVLASCSVNPQRHGVNEKAYPPPLGVWARSSISQAPKLAGSQ
jgi:hypothetical protein